MVLTPSRMNKLGLKAENFSLPDVVTGKIMSLKDFDSKKVLLVMFICRHCPYVKHVQFELARLGRDYSKKDIGIVAISSNDAENYKEDSPQSLKEMAKELDFKFPYLYDESQKVAHAYEAACTPDFFLYDKNRNLYYRGQLDDSRPGNGKSVTGQDLREAIDAVLVDRPAPKIQKASIGCNIKWKSGNEPHYFKN